MQRSFVGLFVGALFVFALTAYIGQGGCAEPKRNSIPSYSDRYFELLSKPERTPEEVLELELEIEKGRMKIEKYMEDNGYDRIEGR